MTHQIRRVSAVMIVLFAALFVNLNVIQLVRADDLIDNPRNRRVIRGEYEIQRGSIVVGGTAIASSEATDDELRYLRSYSDPLRYAHLTGYYSFVLQRSGLEQAMNDTLTGTTSQMIAENLVDLFAGRDRTGDTIVLTIDPKTQQAAQSALGNRVGAVVALDATTGAVLASWSSPSYDPNLLSSHDAAGINTSWRELLAAPDEPLLDRVTREHFPPGSVFKLITAAAALERGITPDTAFPDADSYTPPGTTREIGNFSPGPCTDTGTISLRDALRVSCNTVFAQLGVELGAEALVATAEAFGFNRRLPYVLPTVNSEIPRELDEPALAQSALGQRDVRATPLQVAMIVATIVNDGLIQRPYVVSEVLDATGRLRRGPVTGPWSEPAFDAQAVSQRTAAQLREMMIAAVTTGTGRRAQIADAVVGGKTGTAEVEGQSPTVWFAGFAEVEGRAVAVAVVLPDAGDDATGGVVAAPIAKAVMEAALGLR